MYGWCKVRLWKAGSGRDVAATATAAALRRGVSPAIPLSATLVGWCPMAAASTPDDACLVRCNVTVRRAGAVPAASLALRSASDLLTAPPAAERCCRGWQARSRRPTAAPMWLQAANLPDIYGSPICARTAIQPAGITLWSHPTLLIKTFQPANCRRFKH
jgi:hypothetical protein